MYFFIACGELGIPTSTLGVWCRQKKEHPNDPLPGRVKMCSDKAKKMKLQKELEKTKRKRDILKKALAIFSKGPGINSNS